VVIGDGPQRPMLEHEAARLGLNGHVIFAGELEGSLRNAVLHLSRVVVLPSLSEGLPVTILEAMALAKPIVTTNVGGNREAVVDGVNGLLVPPRDPEALASAVHRLVSDEALAARLGQAGRRRFEACFSLHQMLQQLETVYAGGS
jgi:glycosyltransferase involved in cell wall biosynthesis